MFNQFSLYNAYKIFQYFVAFKMTEHLSNKNQDTFTILQLVNLKNMCDWHEHVVGG